MVHECMYSIDLIGLSCLKILNITLDFRSGFMCLATMPTTTNNFSVLYALLLSSAFLSAVSCIERREGIELLPSYSESDMLDASLLTLDSDIQ